MNLTKSFTTRERNILEILLDVNEPICTKEIADRVHLSKRQVNYSIKGINTWLKTTNLRVQSKPGIGVVLDCDQDQKNQFKKQLGEASHLQIVLTPEQRQQLICFYLLFETESVILTQLALFTKVSRSTIISDLGVIEVWLDKNGIYLERKQNYGVFIAGSENLRQQAIIKILWGNHPFGKPLFFISFQNGFVFTLHQDAQLLPLVEKIDSISNLIDMKTIINKVVIVEDILGGRFTDEAVLFLALVLSILVLRVDCGKHIVVSDEQIKDFQKLSVWEAATRFAHCINGPLHNSWNDSDIAYLVMNMLSLPRADNWMSGLDPKNWFKNKLFNLLNEISSSYEKKSLLDDLTLREGLINHLIPVVNQQKFGLWFPKSQAGLSQGKMTLQEIALSKRILETIDQYTGILLPPDEVNAIAALLRAADIRLRPNNLNRVVVICPSGMATAQLLTARLSTRFPNLGDLKVMSYRELDQENIKQVDLIITLMPLPEGVVNDAPVIQVSPQLLSEDIDAITEFLS